MSYGNHSRILIFFCYCPITTGSFFWMLVVWAALFYPPTQIDHFTYATQHFSVRIIRQRLVHLRPQGSNGSVVMYTHQRLGFSNNIFRVCKLATDVLNSGALHCVRLSAQDRHNCEDLISIESIDTVHKVESYFCKFRIWVFT